jgi:hypothetical protein
MTSHSGLTGDATSDEWKRDFAGKEFVVGIQMGYTDIWRDGKIPKNQFYPNPPYWVHLYPIERKAWIVESIASGDGKSCPRGRP